MKLVIGLVGPIASGKGFLGKYLADHGFFYTHTSDRVREEATRRGLKLERKILQDLGNEMRASFGPAVTVERCLPLIPKETELLVIDGMRNPMEVWFVKEYLGNSFILGVDAPTELRLKWYLRRAVERGEDGVSEEDFWRANNRDLGLGEDQLGQQGMKVYDMRGAQVYNDGTDRMMLECNELLRGRFGIDLEGRRKDKERD